jgi:uncharacterized membrane protein YjjB (DUF3815 family)
MGIGIYLVENAFWAGLAAVGFAILFNVPVRTLPAVAFCGAFAHTLRTFLIQYGVSIEAGTLIGATLVGLMGEFLSQKLHTPASVFTIPGVIPMVPGTFAFKTMMGVIRLTYADPVDDDDLLTETVSNAIKTGIILSCLSLGIAVMHIIFKKHLK